MVDFSKTITLGWENAEITFLETLISHFWQGILNLEAFKKIVNYYYY